MTPSGVQAPVELLRALAVLAEPPETGHARVADALGLGPAPDGAAYADAFLFQFYPYASVYLGAEGMLGGDARDRIAGFWRAVGRNPPAEPDHVSALLGLYAALLDETADAGPSGDAEAGAAERAMIRQSAVALLHEHLAPWLFTYLDRVSVSTVGFFGAWATLTASVLASELASAGVPERLPACLREAPALPDPRLGGGGGFAAALVAPVRTGMIVTRADLGVLGRSLGLGLRVGERRFMLDHLLAQNAPGVLAGLADTAASAAALHAARRPILGVVADFWAARARSTATLLHALAREGGDALDAVEPVPATEAVTGVVT